MQTIALNRFSKCFIGKKSHKVIMNNAPVLRQIFLILDVKSNRNTKKIFINQLIYSYLKKKLYLFSNNRHS